MVLSVLILFQIQYLAIQDDKITAVRTALKDEHPTLILSVDICYFY